LPQIHQMLEAETAAAYFPSYEIMMDELRDYRFYAEDMMHPNATAIQYIWEQFASASIATECLEIMEVVESIQKRPGAPAIPPGFDITFEIHRTTST